MSLVRSLLWHGEVGAVNPRLATENLERLARALECVPKRAPCFCAESKRRCWCNAEWRVTLAYAIDYTIRCDEFRAQEAARLALKKQRDAELSTIAPIPKERWSDVDAALEAAAAEATP